MVAHDPHLPPPSNARGYIELGMVSEASDELEAIDWDGRMKPEVLATRAELYHAAKNWELMEAVSRGLAVDRPDVPQGWVHWAYALRAQEKVSEAKDVVLQGLERHPDESILHFNLACYYSLLAEFPEAKKHLNRAIKLDEMFKAAAVEDEDLAGL